MAVDPSAILPGYSVFARPAILAGGPDSGQYVGVVEDVIEQQERHYLRVAPPIAEASELYIPILAVRDVVGKQVHLDLTMEQLLGQAWYLPPDTGG
jgi:hypothetical protein